MNDVLKTAVKRAASDDQLAAKYSIEVMQPDDTSSLFVDADIWQNINNFGVTQVTYSFPWADTTSPYFKDTYFTVDTSTGFGLNEQQILGFEDVLEVFSRYANLQFQRVWEDDLDAGDIRVGFAEIGSGGLAHFPPPATYYNTANATLSSIYAQEGDIWFHSSYENDLVSADPGLYSSTTTLYQTAIHEIGHALGLEHPFEDENSTTVLDADRDHVAFTVMSYWPARIDTWYFVESDQPDELVTQKYLQPSTPGMIDILALQQMYGANLDYNSGDTTYAFDKDMHFFETIWDAGGTDTIDLSDYPRKCTISLIEGSFSNIGYDSLDDWDYSIDWETDFRGAIVLSLAFNSRIENAIGGLDDDLIIGNYLDNVLSGGPGDDKLDGGIGNDRIIGGSGTDTVVLDAKSSDVSVFTENDTISIAWGNQSVTTSEIEYFEFQNVTLNSKQVVNIGNTAPTIYTPSSIKTNEDTATGAIQYSATDLDGDPITYSFSNPEKGIITLYESVGSDGNRSFYYIYTPDLNANGQDSFSITVNDGTEDVVQSISVTIDPINDLPDLTDYSEVLVDYANRDPLGAIELLRTDVDGDPLTYSFSDPVNGFISTLGEYAYTYTPKINASSDGFYLTASDGIENVVQQVSVTITNSADDFSANLDTISEIEVGHFVVGNIEDSLDQDWHSVILEANEKYTIDLMGTDSGGGTLNDPQIISIIDALGADIQNSGDDDSGVGYDSRVVFIPTVTGKFYINVGAWYSPGSYTLSVKKETSNNYTTTVDVATTVVSRSGASLSDVALSFDDGSEVITVNTNESGLSTASITSGSDLTVTGSLDYAKSSKSVTSQDALDALRLSVGMDTQSGTSTAFDYIAADFNQDGRVTSQDALAILKYSVGLPTTEQAEWVFVDRDGDYSDISRTNANYDEGITITDLTAETEVSLTSILIGDVNDSYSGMIA